MDNIWLERIGIIMNFLAGFMIAPELIGEKRLIQISEKIQKFIKDIQNAVVFLQKRNWVNSDNLLIAYFLNMSSQENHSLHSQYTTAHVLLLIFSVTFVQIIHFIARLYIENDMTRLYIYMSFYSLGFISYLLGLLSRVWRPVIYLATIMYLLFELYLGWAVALFYLLFDLLNYILDIMVSYVSQKKFRASLVLIGILIYLVGNVLQLAATIKWIDD